MRTKVKKVAASATTLARLLEALEHEMIEATDEEILDAARTLGMNPCMKESAAFAGLKYFANPQLSDFFEFDICRNLRGRIAGSSHSARILEDSNIPQTQPLESPGDQKNSSGEESS